MLSAAGRDLTADRWYAGEHGPRTALANAAPAPCLNCGFLIRLGGPLGRAFGVCANEYAPDDGRVVSLDHGCGAHSEATAPAGPFAGAALAAGGPGYDLVDAAGVSLADTVSSPSTAAELARLGAPRPVGPPLRRPGPGPLEHRHVPQPEQAFRDAGHRDPDPPAVLPGQLAADRKQHDQRHRPGRREPARNELIGPLERRGCRLPLAGHRIQVKPAVRRQPVQAAGRAVPKPGAARGPGPTTRNPPTAYRNTALPTPVSKSNDSG